MNNEQPECECEKYKCYDRSVEACGKRIEAREVIFLVDNFRMYVGQAIEDCGLKARKEEYL